MTCYKIVLIGEAKMGKTLFVNRLRGQRLNKNNPYVPTLGVEVYAYIYNETVFEIWDCAGQDKFKGLDDGYYIKADAALILTDELPDATPWITKFYRVNPDKPYMVENNEFVNFPRRKFDVYVRDLFDRLLAKIVTTPAPKAETVAEILDSMINKFERDMETVANIQKTVLNSVGLVEPVEIAEILKELKTKGTSLPRKKELLLQAQEYSLILLGKSQAALESILFARK